MYVCIMEIKHIFNNTLAANGLPGVACPCIITLMRCSPTILGTNSALNSPSPVCCTVAGTLDPLGPLTDH